MQGPSLLRYDLPAYPLENHVAPFSGNVSCLFTGLMLYKPPSDN